MAQMFSPEQVDEAVKVAEETIVELRQRADDLDAAMVVVRSLRGKDSAAR